MVLYLSTSNRALASDISEIVTAMGIPPAKNNDVPYNVILSGNNTRRESRNIRSALPVLPSATNTHSSRKPKTSPRLRGAHSVMAFVSPTTCLTLAINREAKA